MCESNSHKGEGSTPSAWHTCVSNRTRSGARHREYRFRRCEDFWKDHLDIIAEHLGVIRRGALVLAIDELGWTVGHHVASEGRALQRRYQFRMVGAGGALD